VTPYVRPGWTGKPLRYSDGKLNHEWAQCPSCLTFHATTFESCNGKREPCDHQCEAHIGEVRCHRPANHLGEHQAKSAELSVQWMSL
jgi:hypothetical protein